jgi:hypothetical protein
MMRTLTAWLLLLAICSESWGQTPSALATLSSTGSTQQVTGDLRSEQGLLAGNNPWLLAGEVSLKPLAGDGAFSEQWLLSSTKLVYQIPLEGTILGGAQFPVMANFADLVANLGTGTKADSLNAAAQALATGADGLNVGVFPYWPLARAEANLRTTLFAGVAAKLNSYPLGEEEGTQSLLAGRFSGGIEFALGQLTGGSKPLTITLAGVLSKFSATAYEKIFDERRSSLMSAEFTAILPLRTGAGVLFEGVGIESRRPAFRLGMVLAGGGKAPQEAASPSRQDAGACSPNCIITIRAASGLNSSATVTVIQDDAAVTATTGPCNLTEAGQTCVFPVKPKQPAEIKLTGTNVTLGGSGCNELKCTLIPSGNATVTVSSTGTAPVASAASATASPYILTPLRTAAVPIAIR